MVVSTKERARKVAGYTCFGLSGYLAFAVLEHLTDRTTARLIFLSILLWLVGAGLLWWRE